MKSRPTVDVAGGPCRGAVSVGPVGTAGVSSRRPLRPFSACWDVGAGWHLVVPGRGAVASIPGCRAQPGAAGRSPPAPRPTYPVLPQRTRAPDRRDGKARCWLKTSRITADSQVQLSLSRRFEGKSKSCPGLGGAGLSLAVVVGR